MAIDVLTEPGSRSPRPAERWDEIPVAPRRVWGKRVFLLSAGITFLAAAGLLIATFTSSQDERPKLTHQVIRGDLLVTVTEQGILESAENTEIKSKVRGWNTVLWVIESGAMVQPGDELVRLDASFIQEQIDERTKYAHWSRSAAERSAADVVRSELAVKEYEEGRYVSELMQLEKDLVIAESQLQTAENMLDHAQLMAASDYVSELEVEERGFAVKQARLEVDLKRTQIDVLKRFTQAEQLQILNGGLASTKARHEANAERAMADASRRDRALEEIQHCLVRADRAGLVIHPNAAEWEMAPIEEGANVHKDQVLLLMPDLSQMQVKVGIHEAEVDRVKKGQIAKVRLPGADLEGEVDSVASVTKPAGWWTGNQVKYDTLIRVPAVDGLRPGMSAEVEIIIARNKDVLTIPVAAILEAGEQRFCWVQTAESVERRTLELGDSNGVFTIVKSGVAEGEEVVLNFLGIPEAVELKKLAEKKSKTKTAVPSSDATSTSDDSANTGTDTTSTSDDTANTGGERNDNNTE